MAEEVVATNEGVEATGNNGARIFGFIALAIYFIWGQGTACAWWMWIVIICLVYLVLTNSAKVLQWALGLLLIGITFFASPSFGYGEIQKGQYVQGIKDGRFASNVMLIESPDEAWEHHQSLARVDISGYKRFYIRGYKRGRSGKED